MSFVSVQATPDLRKSLNTIFHDQYMKENTNFTCFMDFQSSSVFLNWQSLVWVYDEDLLDGFVKESTRFSTWTEMVMDAANKAFAK